MGIEIIRPGLLTSVQDLGRRGWGKFGVTRGGALDGVALRIANWLVGNDEGAAGLEFTLIGPSLRFTVEAEIAICGASMTARCGEQIVPGGRPVRMGAGATLQFGSATRGARAYLAVRGGFDVPEVLGSRSTDLPAGFGGLAGRALAAGDRLEWRTLPPPPEDAEWPSSEAFAARSWFAQSELQRGNDGPIRFLRGRHVGQLGATAIAQFAAARYELSPDSNRIGYRLVGPTLSTGERVELRSEAALPGTIQVPPSGQPIILLADGPVTGGYPKLGQVAAVDLPRLAQLRPGDALRFTEVTWEEAERLWSAQQRDLARMRQGLAWRRLSLNRPRSP